MFSWQCIARSFCHFLHVIYTHFSFLCAIQITSQMVRFRVSSCHTTYHQNYCTYSEIVQVRQKYQAGCHFVAIKSVKSTKKRCNNMQNDLACSSYAFSGYQAASNPCKSLPAIWSPWLQPSLGRSVWVRAEAQQRGRGRSQNIIFSKVYLIL